MKVRATNKYKEKGLKDKELGRIPKEGEEFEVTAERFEILNGYNSFNEVFVTLVEDETKTEETTEAEATEEAENSESTTSKNSTKTKKK